MIPYAYMDSTYIRTYVIYMYVLSSCMLPPISTGLRSACEIKLIWCGPTWQKCWGEPSSHQAPLSLTMFSPSSFSILLKKTCFGWSTYSMRAMSSRAGQTHCLRVRPLHFRRARVVDSIPSVTLWLFHKVPFGCLSSAPKSLAAQLSTSYLKCTHRANSSNALA